MVSPVHVVLPYNSTQLISRKSYALFDHGGAQCLVDREGDRKNFAAKVLVAIKRAPYPKPYPPVAKGTYFKREENKFLILVTMKFI